MKITFQHLNRDFAEEYYFVLVNQKKLLRHPSKPIRRVTKIYGFYCLFAFVCFAASVLLAINSFSYLPLCFLTGFTLGLMIFVSLKVVKAVRSLSDASAKKYSLDLTTKGAAYTLPGGDILMPWENVLNIIFTQHSVVFIPNTLEILPICVPIETADKIKTQLKKLKRTELILK